MKLSSYFKNKEQYKSNIIQVKEKLKASIPQIDQLFYSANFEELIVALDDADQNVTKHYREYQKTNEVWSRLKHCIKQ